MRVCIYQYLSLSLSIYIYILSYHIISYHIILCMYNIYIYIYIYICIYTLYTNIYIYIYIYTYVCIYIIYTLPAAAHAHHCEPATPGRHGCAACTASRVQPPAPCGEKRAAAGPYDDDSESARSAKHPGFSESTNSELIKFWQFSTTVL